MKSQSIAKTRETLNQLGGSTGGPTVRHRVFFFVDYEGYQERRLTQIDDVDLNTSINSGTFGQFRGTQGERIIQINTRLTF